MSFRMTDRISRNLKCKDLKSYARLGSELQGQHICFSLRRPCWHWHQIWYHQESLCNILRPAQYGWHFANNILKCIFFKENFHILIEILLKFVSKASLHNKSALPLPMTKYLKKGKTIAYSCNEHIYSDIYPSSDLAPVPLTRFQSNSKFDHIWQCSGFKCALPITTKFCTCHDSVTVVTYAKFRCDWLSIFQTRALPILIEFRIRSKYR